MGRSLLCLLSSSVLVSVGLGRECSYGALSLSLSLRSLYYCFFFSLACESNFEQLDSLTRLLHRTFCYVDVS